ncbi:polyketide cyclase [Streptomyces sulfonofaciens]|uniref:Polyketide cyclase n=1 Tax=Streptomyces sulfonofaciens TaxID=68272 RepID=A0A919G8S7_9ACTN|nr:cyclase family protein [Streptomyces sulfonofaciens]GHH79365.1 polyketide cyclase [Streptomyces sulfonofaciens]
MTEPARRAPHSDVPRPYGDDDRIGAANEIGPEAVTAAARLVADGRRYALGQVLRPSSPHQMWRYWKHTLLTDRTAPERGFGTNRQTFVEEAVSGALHSGTHLDGLGHIGIGSHAYGGRPWADIISAEGLTDLGIEHVPPLVTRGILLDVAAVHATDVLGDQQPVTAEDLAAAEEAAGVRVRVGDIVLLHTGWGAHWDGDGDRYARSEPGLDLTGARWLLERRVTVIGADNWAVERVPLTPGEESFPVHQETITRHGVYLMENVRTEELAADGAHEFLCVVAPLRLQGASGSMVNPVAVV